MRAAAIAATTAAVARSGPIVAVAGLAVAAGTATLLAAESPFFRALGPALAFTVTVGLVVAITLVPALMAILGGLVFWPPAPPARRAAPTGRERPGRGGRARWRARPRLHPALAGGGDRPVHRLAPRRLLVLVPRLVGLALAAGLVLRLDLGVSFIGALPPTAPVRATAARPRRASPRGSCPPARCSWRATDVAEQRGGLRRLGTALAGLPGVAGVLGPGSQPGPVERQLLLSATVTPRASC